MKEELLRLNDQIAWIDAREKNEEWISATAKLKQVESSIDELKAAAECLISNREAQEAILRQTAIAVDVINGYLANIYFDAHRFELVPKGDKYAIRSRGCPVSLRDISTGERNILALCYFFSEGGRNRREGSQDDDPQYIVLDDPISSFDMENRIGIISLIRRRSEHILERNLSSRITVLTHDSGVVAELKHTFDDINNQMKSRQQAFTTDYLEIRSCSTQALPMKETEYSSLLKRAYEYAASEDEDANESLVIGNVLRRILEAFSTFNYGLSMEGLSRDKDLVPRFGKAAPILENMMYRLALNDESHMKERLSSLNPTMSFERYSFENKRACAQCAILILNKLDSAHVGKLLAKRGISEGDVSLNIKAWAERFTPSSKGSIVDDLNPS